MARKIKLALLTLIIMGSVFYAFGNPNFVQASDSLENPDLIAQQQVDYEHHYVVFLNGVNSHASANDDEPLDGKFNLIEDELRRHGLSKFVYFSYSAASFGKGNFCKGWGDSG